MNKGLKLRFCKECGCKRFCSKISIPNHNYRFTCSKGHTWILVGITLERIESAMRETFNPERLKNLFERDDTFFRALKK